jgi:hypothetical protein
MTKKSPTTATFYILDQTILYTVPGDGTRPLDHAALWPHVTAKMFPALDPYSRRMLDKAPFGAERGRVILNGSTFTLVGTPGVAAFRTRLQRLFGLLGVDQKYQEKFLMDSELPIRMHDRSLIENHFDVMKKGRGNLRIA